MMKSAPIRAPISEDSPDDLYDLRQGSQDDLQANLDVPSGGTVPVGLLDTLGRTVKIAASRLTQNQPSSASWTPKKSSVTAQNSRNSQQTSTSNVALSTLRVDCGADSARER